MVECVGSSTVAVVRYIHLFREAIKKKIGKILEFVRKGGGVSAKIKKSELKFSLTHTHTHARTHTHT